MIWVFLLIAVELTERPAPLLTLGTRDFRHPTIVTSHTFRPDGKVLVTSAMREAFVREWDAKTGRELRRFEVPKDVHPSPWVIGYSADGKRLVVYDDLKWVITLDTDTGKVLSRFASPGGWPSVSPDGKSIATLDGDRLAIWNPETGKPVRTIKEVTGWRVWSRFSPDSKQIVAWTGTKSVYVAQVDGSKPAREVAVHGISEAVVWLGGDRLVAGWTGGLGLYDPATGKELARKDEARDRYLSALHVTSSGKVLVGTRFSQKLAEVDPVTLATKWERELALELLASWIVSPDGSCVAARVEHAGDHAIRLFDTATGKPLVPDRDAQPISPPGRMRFSVDGRLMAAVSQHIYVWNLTTGKAVAFGGPMAHRIGFDLSPDGLWVVEFSGYQLRDFIVWDATTGKETARTRRPTAMEDLIGFDADGRFWVRDHRSEQVSQFDVSGFKTLQTVKGYPREYGQLLSFPNRRGMAVSTEKTFSVLKTEPDAKWVPYPSLDQAPGTGGCTGFGIFSPDGRRMLTYRSDSRELHLVDTTGSPVGITQAKFPGALGGLSNITFSPDGRRFAFSIWDDGRSGPIQVWETATFAPVYQFMPPGGLTEFALPPDGKRLVVSHADTTLTVWNLEAVERYGLGAAGKRNVPVKTRVEELSSRDPKVGLAAIHALISDPKQAVTLLTEQFPIPDAAKVTALIARLGDEDFATREKASDGLSAFGFGAEAVLRKAVKSEMPEVRDRAIRLLRAFESTNGRLPAIHIRAIRAVEVLERIGSPEAKALLAKWATGHAGTLLGAEAKAALDRLATK